jgi:hypothetical protein
LTASVDEREDIYVVDRISDGILWNTWIGHNGQYPRLQVIEPRCARTFPRSERNRASRNVLRTAGFDATDATFNARRQWRRDARRKTVVR